MTVAGDPFTLRCEAERLVGEDWVPAEELAALRRVRRRRVGRPAVSRAMAAPPRRHDPRRRGAPARAPAPRRGPAALRLDGAEAIEALFNAAYDSDLAMLDELVERAGLGWKCRAEVAGYPCHYMNVGTARCHGCGAGEQEGKEDADG